MEDEGESQPWSWLACQMRSPRRSPLRAPPRTRARTTRKDILRRHDNFSLVVNPCMHTPVLNLYIHLINLANKSLILLPICNISTPPFLSVRQPLETARQRRMTPPSVPRLDWSQPKLLIGCQAQTASLSRDSCQPALPRPRRPAVVVPRP